LRFSLLIGVLGITSLLTAQTESSVYSGVTLAEIVQKAIATYPSIQVSQEQLNAAAAGILLARTAYLPKVDLLAQANRATRNNVFGLLLPQSAIPAISGPVLGTNNFGTAWGSVAGTLVTWEPFDFGLRRSYTEAARAQRNQSEATLKRSRFEVAIAAADAYLTLVASQETVRAAQASVERSNSVLRVIAALVAAELRPGADASRAEAELAATRIQVVQASQAVEAARANLTRFSGLDTAQLSLAATKLLELPAEQVSAPFVSAANPLVAEQNATAEQAWAQLRTLERSYFPHFYLQGSAYARGTGAELDGRLAGGLNGLAPTTQNYALGLTVTFAALDLPSLRAKEAMQIATARSQEARSRQLATEIHAQWKIAVAAVQSSRAIAAITPVQVASARNTLRQATARYRAGLSNIEEVAEAQRLVTQSEIDHALARLNVWRALLGVSAAAGDIEPFVAEASR